ncbi:MAG: antitoxin MazE family protein [Chloroflexota bacterium]|nr:antitoxin MazE family protein [Chloroflexota bacterium]
MAHPNHPNRSPGDGETGREPGQGLGRRPIQTLLPDVRSSAFREEARRQSLAVANSLWAEEDQAFIDAISTWGEDDESERRGT